MTVKQIATGSTMSWISVKDMEKAKDLFVNTLGFEINDENPEFGWLEVKGSEGSIIGIGKENDDDAMTAGQNAIICINCEDLDAMMAQMKERGIAFHGEIIEIPNEVKMILFSDADGNKFHLVQYI